MVHRLSIKPMPEFFERPSANTIPTAAVPSPRYLFSGRSAAVLGSSNDSTAEARELYQISPALKLAAPATGALR